MTGSTKFSHEYYQRVYRNYALQNPQRKIDWGRSVVQAVLTDIPSPRICDIGCAFGAAVHSFENKWFTCGFDVGIYSISQAVQKSTFRRLGLASCTNIPLKNESLHAVTAFDVLEHIENLELCAREIRQVLKPVGSLIFTISVYDGPLGTFVKTLDKDPTHCHKHSRHFWLSWVKTNFTLTHWTGALRYLLPWNQYIHVHSRSIRSFSPAILITAKI